MLDVVFSIDTTQSMSHCLNVIRQRVQEMITFLQARFPAARIGLVAQGDYSSRNYVTKEIDLTNDTGELCEFLESVEPTYGIDASECYELVLHKVQGFSWANGSERVLVFFGDSLPHKSDYRLNKDHIDWRTETDNLSKMVRFMCLLPLTYYNREGKLNFKSYYF